MTELPDILVVMALAAESDGVFEAAGIPVLYCGVGKVNAAVALTRELRRYVHGARRLPSVLNFGSAGSRVHATGSLVSCHEFVQRDMDVSGLGFALGVTPFDDAPPTLSFERRFEDLPSAVCGSGDSFATSACAVECGVPFACVKYVTDGADHAAADHWRDNVHKAAEEFLRLYVRVRDAG
jgi:adenosylhomocysteine nucleosidase